MKNLCKNVEVLVKNGVSVNDIVEAIKDGELVESHLQFFLELKADVNLLAKKVRPNTVSKNLNTWLKEEYGGKIDKLLPYLDAIGIIENIELITAHGAKIDDVKHHLTSQIQHDAAEVRCASYLTGLSLGQITADLSWVIVNNLDNLKKHGIEVDIDQLTEALFPDGIGPDCTEELLRHGAKISLIVKLIDSKKTLLLLDLLLNYGAKIEKLLKNLDDDDIIENLDTLLDHGAKIDDIISVLKPSYVSRYREELMDRGAKIEKLAPKFFKGNFDKLLTEQRI